MTASHVPADAALPKLPSLFASGGLPPAIAEAAATLTGLPLQAGGGRLTYQRYWPGRRSVSQWTLPAPDGSEVIVSGEMRPERQERRDDGDGLLVEELDTWLQVFPHDRVLPAIERAISQDWIDETLRGLLELDARDEVTCRPLSYKSWRRCVIEYSIRRDGAETRVYAKLFRDDRGAELFGRLRKLESALEQADGPWIVPRTLAYDSDVRLLLQAELPAADSLSGVAQAAVKSSDARAALFNAVEGAADGLTGWQALAIEGVPLVRVDDVLESLNDDLDSIALVARSGAVSLRACLSDLEQLTASRRPDRAALSHAAFRHSHIYPLGDQLGLLDLDNLCLRDANADPGYFLAYLSFSSLKRPRLRALLQECRQLFLDRWRKAAAYDTGWLAFHTNAVLLKWVIRAFFSLEPKWPELFRAARELCRETLTQTGGARSA